MHAASCNDQDDEIKHSFLQTSRQFSTVFNEILCVVTNLDLCYHGRIHISIAVHSMTMPGNDPIFTCSPLFPFFRSENIACVHPMSLTHWLFQWKITKNISIFKK